MIVANIKTPSKTILSVHRELPPLKPAFESYLTVKPSEFELGTDGES